MLEGYPLSPQQKRVWALQEASPHTPYCVQCTVRIAGPLDRGALVSAVRRVVASYEILRTALPRSARMVAPLQVIDASDTSCVPLLDISALKAPGQVALVAALFERMRGEPFDLQHGPLFQARYVALAPDQHLLLLRASALCADAATLGELVREISRCYRGTGRSEDDGDPLQYADIAEWQTNLLEADYTEEGRAYWRRQNVAGGLTVRPLFAQPRGRAGFAPRVLRLALSRELSERVGAAAQRCGTAASSLLLACWHILLWRLADQPPASIATGFSWRKYAELADAIGPLASFIPVACPLAAGMTFQIAVARLDAALQDAGAWHEYFAWEPGAGMAAERAQPSFCPVAFEFDELPPPYTEDGITFAIDEQYACAERFEIKLSARRRGTALHAEIHYNDDMFAMAEIARLASCYQTLLESALDAPNAPITKLGLLSARERHQLLVEWNDTATGVRGQGSGVRSGFTDVWLHQLFEVQVAHTPDAVALMFDSRKDERRTTNDDPTKDEGRTTNQSLLSSFVVRPSSSVQLTYSELDRRANQLAQHLRARGVGPDVCVGICAERSLELVIALLGVHKAGGAYLPLDPDYPAERINFMLEDSGAALMIVASNESFDKQTRRQADKGTDAASDVTLSRRMVDLRGDWPIIAQQPARAPASEVSGENLAYVIYTSGSTGAPKGVMIAHRALNNRLRWMQDTYALTATDRVLQKTSFSFDVSVWEFFWPLLNGACLVLARPGGQWDSAYLVGLIGRSRITTLHFVPSMLEVFVDEPGLERCMSLRQVLCSGEALPYAAQERCFARLGARLHNLYGPTEAAIDVTAWACERGGAQRVVPIGRPIANTRIYLLDAQLEPAPIGIAGELYIGGVQLARGYLGRPDLTAARFLPNPFVVTNDERRTTNDERADSSFVLRPSSETRLYKTGDSARYRPDGAIEYLGRRDGQVKLRGFRIELGEIEAALARHPAVRQAVVVLRAEAPNASEYSQSRLVAYVVPTNDQRSTTADDRRLTIDDGMHSELSSIVHRPSSLASELRVFLKQRLPDYMLPAAFVELDALPLTPNGKLDRKALPAPDSTRRALASTYVAPRTPAEATLARIWATALRRDTVGVEDDFFALGGDSILSIQIVAQARAAGLALTPKDLFEHRTITALARVAGVAEAVAAPQGLVEGPVPLTPIQRWFFARGLPEPQHFSQVALIPIARPLDLASLGRAVQQLLWHHDALRLRFTREASGWQARHAAPTARPPFHALDLGALPLVLRVRALMLAASVLQASLDLARGPLLRAVLFDLGAGQPAQLLLIVHHLVIDGVSWRIVLEDLQSAYAQLRQGQVAALPPKTSSFQQWAQQLVAYAEGEAVRTALDYWLAPDWPAAIPLPRDYPGGANTLGSARQVSALLDEEETTALLHEVPPVYQTQTDEVLLTALALVWEQWAGARSLLVDLEGHGREELDQALDVTRTVGWLTSLYPLRLALPADPDLGAALKAIKEQVRAVPQRGLPYGLGRYLRAEPRLAAQPPAPLLFNYLGQLDQALLAGGPSDAAQADSAPAQNVEGMRTHPLELNGLIAGGRLRLQWTYSAQLHAQETIERLAEAHADALRAIIAHCRAPDAGGFTPADFPLMQFSQDQLDEALAQARFNAG